MDDGCGHRAVMLKVDHCGKCKSHSRLVNGRRVLEGNAWQAKGAIPLQSTARTERTRRYGLRLTADDVLLKFAMVERLG